MYTSIHSSFSLTAQTETTHMSFKGEWISELCVAQPLQGTLLSSEQEGITNTTWRLPRALCRVKKSQSQQVKYCMILFM